MASEERDQLLANLRRLQLRHAVNRIDDLLRDAAHLKLGHLGFLARVVDCEVLGRTETATNRRIQEAHFREIFRIEDYDFKEQPSLDRKTILDLAELGFLDRCESVFFLGPSGVGKTHLSIGLGMRACAAGVLEAVRDMSDWKNRDKLPKGTGKGVTFQFAHAGYDSENKSLIITGGVPIRVDVKVTSLNIKVEIGAGICRETPGSES